MCVCVCVCGSLSSSVIAAFRGKKKKHGFQKVAPVEIITENQANDSTIGWNKLSIIQGVSGKKKKKFNHLKNSLLAYPVRAPLIPQVSSYLPEKKKEKRKNRNEPYGGRTFFFFSFSFAFPRVSVVTNKVMMMAVTLWRLIPYVPHVSKRALMSIQQVLMRYSPRKTFRYQRSAVCG